jgi:hypothetical protein
MGRRGAFLLGLAFVGLSLLAAGLLASMRGADGRTAWQVLAGGQAISAPPKITPEQARKRNMSMITVTGPTNPRGCSNFLPGETVRFGVTANAEDPANPGGISLTVQVTYDGSGGTLMEFLSPWPSGPQNHDTTAPSQNFNIRFRAPLEYFGAEVGYTYEDHDYTVPVDTTTKPSFSGYSCGISDCDPFTYVASVYVNRADSWSYRLVDAGGNTVSGGTPNSPSTAGCSFLVIVDGIVAGTPVGIEFTATNPNGTTTETFSLGIPALSVSLEADDTSITAGGDVVLSWGATGAASVSIDNGIGEVWSGTSEATPSGTETVSPLTTTTYTITATGPCGETDTATVTINVEGIPIPGMASITWVAQDGIGSRKTARFTEPAVLNWTAIDPSRTPRTVRVSARASVREDVRTPRTARVSARSEVRGNRTVRVSARATCRRTIEVRVSARARSVYPDRFHVKARNVATGVVSEWGAIDADTSPLTLADVSIPAGTYSVWVEREGVFWKDARVGSEFTVVITDGQPPLVLALPMATNLAASISGGLTLLSWDASSGITDDGLSWGLWFNATSPVTITGEPTYRFLAAIGQSDYEYVIDQSASEYVSVAAIGSDGTRGVAAELYLPWSTTSPNSPANQTANC